VCGRRKVADERYADQRFRRTAAQFWGSPWSDKTFQRQMRESRKVEDLILPFVTSATKALKKDDELVEGAWKWELNIQISTFLSIITDSLSALGPIPLELASRLDSYKTRLQAPEPEKIEPEVVKAVVKDEGLKGDATVAVAQLFGVGEERLQQMLKGMQGICTEQAALDDLKVG
jgi:hypothetical protein